MTCDGATPTATIVICTRNRAPSLRRTLQHLAGQRDADAARWNVLVVNNGSDDETSDVVDEFSAALRIREVFEPLIGISNARNRGVREADGRYIIWTDDDVIPSDHWIAAYLKAFDRNPGQALYGGRIDVVYEEPEVVPYWLLANERALHLMLTVRSPGPEMLHIPNTRRLLPFCANAAASRDVLLCFPFDPEMGYAPGRNLGGEEMDVFERMIAAGCRGLWVPEAIVCHVTDKNRQTTDHVRRFYKRVGETTYCRKSPRELGYRHVARLIIKWAAATALYAILSAIAPSLSIRALMSASYHAGALQRLVGKRHPKVAGGRDMSLSRAGI